MGGDRRAGAGEVARDGTVEPVPQFGDHLVPRPAMIRDIAGAKNVPLFAAAAAQAKDCAGRDLADAGPERRRRRGRDFLDVPGEAREVGPFVLDREQARRHGREGSLAVRFPVEQGPISGRVAGQPQAAFGSVMDGKGIFADQPARGFRPPLPPAMGQRQRRTGRGGEVEPPAKLIEIVDPPVDHAQQRAEADRQMARARRRPDRRLRSLPMCRRRPHVAAPNSSRPSSAVRQSELAQPERPSPTRPAMASGII